MAPPGKVSHVLLATDGSTAARRATAMAAVLAARDQARLSIVHVAVAGEADCTAPDPQLMYLSRRLGAMGIAEVEVYVLGGHPASAILGLAQTLLPDVLVLGARGGRRQTPLGEVGAAVARGAACPVLVVR